MRFETIWRNVFDRYDASIAFSDPQPRFLYDPQIARQWFRCQQRKQLIEQPEHGWFRLIAGPQHNDAGVVARRVSADV